MQNIVNCNFKIDKTIKNRFDILCTELGVTMSAAINMFIRQSVSNNGLSIDLNRNQKEREDLLRKINNAYKLRSKAVTLYTDEEIEKIWDDYKKDGRRP